MISTSHSENYTDQLLRRFYITLKYDLVNEIINEERALKKIKSLYIQHAFDDSGQKYKNIYEAQFEYVKTIKRQYKEKYA